MTIINGRRVLQNPLRGKCRGISAFKGPASNFLMMIFINVRLFCRADYRKSKILTTVLEKQVSRSFKKEKQMSTSLKNKKWRV